MLIVTLRSVIMYAVIIFAMRLMGKRQLGELQPSELVTTFLISNLASLPIEETDLSLITGILPIALIAALEILMSVLELKSKALSKLVTGSSKIIIRAGVVDQSVMRELRYGITELLEALRGRDIYDLREVELGIIETNGTLNTFSFQGLTEHRLMVPIVLEGKFNRSALTFLGRSEQEARGYLRQHGTASADVLVLMADKSGDYYLIRREP